MKIKSPSRFFNSAVQLMPFFGGAWKTNAAAKAAAQECSLCGGFGGGNRPLPCGSIRGAIKWLQLLAFITLAFGANSVTASAQNSPPSRPILFVHGWCGSAYDWAPLYNSLFQTFPTSMYPNQAVFLVQYNSVTNTISFWTENDPSAGANSVLTPIGGVGENPIPPSARFFALQLIDPNSQGTETTDPVNVTKISILNKAYEISQVIARITSITGIPQVNIVAHSMGGLDARAYVENLASPGACYNYQENTPLYVSPCDPGSANGSYVNDVANIITVDTPHAGSPMAQLNLQSFASELGACIANPSTNQTELIPTTDNGGWSFVERLNYSGFPFNSALPSVNNVPIQAVEDYFSDVTTAWDGLTGESDDIVQRDSQAITSDSQTVTANIPGPDTTAILLNLPIPYTDSPNNIDPYVANTPACWPVGNSAINTPILHYMTCLGALPATQIVIAAQLISDTVPWISSWTVTPTTLSLGGSVTIGYSASDLSTSTLSRAELWRAPDANGVPGMWTEVESPQTPSGNGPTLITFTDSPTAVGKYWYGTHLFDSAGNEATEPSPTQVTVGAAAQAPTVTIQASPTQVTQGSNVTLSATVQSSIATPTGTVTFYDGSSALSPAIALNNVGAAAYSTNVLSLGSHSITARYSGSTSFSSSTSTPITVTVTIVYPQLSVSPSTGVPGVTAFVKSDTGFTPSGLITHTATFPDNSVSVLQTYADVNGNYSYSRTYSMVGPYSQIDTDGTTGKTTTSVPWTVSAVVANDFSLQMSPSTQTVNQGATVTYTVITSTTSGSSQSIALSASNLPTGVTASFSPSTVTSGSQSILTLSATSAAATGTYSLTLVGVGISASHTIPFSATVAQATTSGALLTASPLSFAFNSQTVDTASAPFVFSLVNTGGTALTISSVIESPQFFASFQNGQGLPLTLQPNGGYANMQVVFVPNAIGQQTGTIKLFNSTNASPLTLNVSGMGVAAPVTTGTIQINATFNGEPWSGGLYYSLSGPESYNGGTAPNTYFNMAPGTYNISYTAGGPGGVTFNGITPSTQQQVSVGLTTTFTFNFTGANTFSMGDPSPLAAVVGAGSSTQIQLGACIETGATQTVTLSASALPPGASVSYSVNPISAGCSATSSVATISTSASTPAGVYPIVFSGTNEDGYVSTFYLPVELTVALPPPAAGQIVSVSSSGVQGNNMSGASNPNFVFTVNPVSGDGRFLAFESLATNLTSNDSSGWAQLFIRDTQAGTTAMISAAADGTPADQGANQPSMSQDGRFVVFASSSGNLTSQSQDGSYGIYLYDQTSGAIRRIDLAPDGTAANGSVAYPAISADGRFIAFSSWATNLIPGAASGSVYVADTTSGQLKLASLSSDGSVQAGGSFPQISADGRYVAFISTASNLVPNDTSGTENAFVHDFATGETTLVNVATDGTQDNCGVMYSSTIPLSMSADGRYVAFVTCGQTLAPSYPNPYSYDSAYLHDMTTGETTPLFVDGQNNIVPVGFVGSISPDGRFVTLGSDISGDFHTSGIPDRYDTYLVDLTAGQVSDLNVASDGSAGNGSAGPAIGSANGGSVVFSSLSSNLVANDTNGTTDVFEFANPFAESPRLTAVSLANTQTSGGVYVSGSVTLNAPAPAGGATVAVWSNNLAAQPPATVVVPAGATSAPVTIPTSLVSSETVMTIIASYNGGSGVALLTLEPAPELAVSPTAWDYGYQPVGTTSAVESLALTNSGTAALTINSVQLTSGQVFNIIANTCGSGIAAGGSCSISVTFSPNGSGSASDAVQISYGSPAAIQSITLTGNGATPVAALSPIPLNFGNQTMPGSATAIATLSNSGNASLTGISASISGTNEGDYAISSDGCSGVILPANSNCNISIAFTPKAKGSRQATLSIADSASGSPQTISLTGTGVQSVPTLLWNPSAAALTYGTPLGSGVLDATANQSGSNLEGSFAYTATVNGGAPQVVTQATVLGAGMYTLTATFTPKDTTDYTTVTATVSITINPATPTVMVSPSASIITTAQALTVTVVVSDGTGNLMPTGSVTLSGGGYTSSATTLSSGSTSINIPAGSLAMGSDMLTASYTPDTASSSTYNSATGSAPVAVTNPAKTTPLVTVTPSSSSITTAQALSVTVAVSGGTGNPTPTGAVTLAGGGFSSAAATLSSGSATISIPAGSLTNGSDTLTVIYTPDSNSSSIYNSATGSNSVTVTTPAKTTPTVTVTPSASSITPAQSLTVTVAVSGETGSPTPTGSVTLSSGSYSVQQTLASGAASFTIAAGTLGNGANTLTASYSGDATYALGSSTTTVTVEPISITSTTPAPINPGSSATSNITLTGSSTYSGTLNLTCKLTTSPSGAQNAPTCSLNPASVTLTSGGSGTSTLTVNTTAASTTALGWPTDQHLWKLGGGGTVLVALLLFGIPFRHRRWTSMLPLLLLVAAVGAIGCGGKGGTSGGGGGSSSIPGTTAGNYSFTVTATDSANATITASTTITVTVE